MGGNAAFDIWEGIWLGKEKVALKTIRGVHVSPDTRKVPDRSHRVSHFDADIFSRDFNARSKFGEKCGSWTEDVTFYRFGVLVSQMGPTRKLSNGFAL